MLHILIFSRILLVFLYEKDVPVTNIEKSLIRDCLYVGIAFFIASYAVGPLTHYSNLSLTVAFMAAGFVATFGAITMMAIRRLQGKNGQTRRTAAT